MFQKTAAHQSSLFASMSSNLSGRRKKTLEDTNAWHNVFAREFLARIDEKPYSVLFDDANGRPNASIRALIAMMVLKEGNDWTDRQLFEQCDFNVLVMRALGFSDLDQQAPNSTTYYKFRTRLGEYLTKHGIDLIGQTFKDITAQQVGVLGLAGRTIRLDSKLLRSNIALGNRVQLIAEAVRVHLKAHEFVFEKVELTEDQTEIIKQLRNKSTANLIYHLTSDNQQALMVDLGYIITHMIAELGEDKLPLLVRLLREQYEAEAGDDDDQSNDEVSDESESENTTETNDEPQIRLRDAKQIEGGSLQSVHDPEATYIMKGEGLAKKKVSGFHANITETCDEEDKPNLIIEVSVKTANISENNFLVPAIETSAEVLKKSKSEKIENVVTDGGYDSIENREVMADTNKPKWDLAKLKGIAPVFDIQKKEDGTYEVYHTKSGEKVVVTYSEKAQKYRFQYGGANRYMTEQAMENYIVAMALIAGSETRDPGLRASVESTIHQVFCKLGKYAKIAYRGAVKCKWYVLGRAFWTNLTRIGEHRRNLSLKLEKEGIIA